MAGALNTEFARFVYTTLQAVSCPMVDGLRLQEADSMLQLLCTPSQHRTDILVWICNSINPSFAPSKDPNVLTKEMAKLGQELMLCKDGDLDLIRGNASPQRQLQFLEQLLTVVSDREMSTSHRTKEETLLNEIFSPPNRPHLKPMLEPEFNPWPEDIEEESPSPNEEEDANVAALLQSTQSTLEQLQSECEFLKNEVQSPEVFSPSSLRVMASDLQQLMTSFSHVYETDLNAYCSRAPPSFSTDADIFQRVHQLLLACTTELEMIKEVSEASVSMNEEVNRLQIQPCYWRRGERHTFLDELQELKRRKRVPHPASLLMARMSNHQGKC